MSVNRVSCLLVCCLVQVIINHSMYVRSSNIKSILFPFSVLANIGDPPKGDT